MTHNHSLAMNCNITVFNCFQTELVATAKELFSSDVETREINRRMPREQSTYKRKGKKEEEGDSDADAANNAAEAGSAVMVVEQPLTTWYNIWLALQIRKLRIVVDFHLSLCLPWQGEDC